jgi:hypothetical protein
MTELTKQMKNKTDNAACSLLAGKTWKYIDKQNLKIYKQAKLENI